MGLRCGNLLGVLLAATLLAACSPAGGRAERPVPGEQPPSGSAEAKGPAPSREVTVYFSNREGTALVPVRRRVPDQQFLPYGAASALFQGPEPSEPAVATIPEGTRLLGLVIRGGTAYVNVSSEFRSHHGGGSTGEILTLYSVVNTLTEFSDVQNVRFMLDGKPLNTFIHMDLSQGLARRQDLIAEP